MATAGGKKKTKTLTHEEGIPAPAPGSGESGYENENMNPMDLPLPSLPILQRNISIRPESSGRLLLCDLNELEKICLESNIDLTSFSTISDLEIRRQEMIKILKETYPPEHDRKYFILINNLVQRMKEDEEQEDNGEMKVRVQGGYEDEINELFIKLLNKFEIEENILRKLMKSFSMVEKIQYLISSVW